MSALIAMGEPDLTFPRVAELAPAATARARDIYEVSFPPRQREHFDAFLDPDADSRASAVVQGDDVVGIAFGRRLRMAPWWFVEYVAVAPEHRSSGIGARIWEHLSDPAQLAGAIGLVLEVEDPTEQAIDPDERTIRERRVRFWQRCGATILPVPQFVVPTLDDTGVERFVLMAHPADAAGRELQQIVRAIYVDGYGLTEDHQLVREAMRGLATGP